MEVITVSIAVTGMIHVITKVIVDMIPTTRSSITGTIIASIITDITDIIDTIITPIVVIKFALTTGGIIYLVSGGGIPIPGITMATAITPVIVTILGAITILGVNTLAAIVTFIAVTVGISPGCQALFSAAVQEIEGFPGG